MVPVDAIPDGWMGLDNGPASTELIQVGGVTVLGIDFFCNFNPPCSDGESK